MATQQEIDQLQANLNALAEQNSRMASILEKNNLLPIPKILIGVPILAWTHEFATSFLKFWTDLMTYQHKGRKFHVGFEFRYRRPVDLAECELAQAAIDAGCTHLLLMDDDIYDVTANDLMTLLDADKDVIGGIMYTSGFPHAMCAFRRYDLTKTVAEQPRLTESCRLYEVPAEQRVGAQMVDLIPFGFTLIKTSVFSKIPKPWFKCDEKAPTDSHFADSVLNAGLQYYAHFDVWLNHRGIRRDNVHFHQQIGMHEAQRNSGRTIELTPEDMQKHEIYVQSRMTEAEKKYSLEQHRRIKFYEKSKDTPVGTLVQAPLPQPVPIINQENKNA